MSEATANVSVAELKDQADGNWVTLQGRLVQRLGDDNYRFHDASGDVQVEVDQDVWHGAQVGPKDLIRIRGQVDHNLNKTTLVVETLEKVL